MEAFGAAFFYTRVTWEEERNIFLINQYYDSCSLNLLRAVVPVSSLSLLCTEG